MRRGAKGGWRECDVVLEVEWVFSQVKKPKSQIECQSQNENKMSIKNNTKVEKVPGKNARATLLWEEDLTLTRA